MDNDQSYISTDESQNEWNTPVEYPRYSRLAEFFILFLWVFLTLEGIFGEYIRKAFDAGNIWWTHLTRWNLFPSELLFYNPIFLLLCVIIIVKGRAWGYKTNRGIFLLLIIMGLGIAGALHGKLAGAPGNFWLADLRQSVLGAFIVPIIVILASSIRLSMVLGRFCKLCVILGIWNGMIGALTFAGVLEESSWMAVSWRGEYILILAYIILATRAIVVGKTAIFSLLAIGFGIIVPFHKPTIATFVFANLFLITLTFLASKRLGAMVYLRSIKMIIFAAIFGAMLVPWIFTLGQGRGREYFETKYLKLQNTAASRDLTGRRFEIWSWGIEEWKKNPVFGTGFGFWIQTDTAEGGIRYVPVHNLLVSWLYQLGLVGLSIAVIVMLVWIFRMVHYFKFCDLSDIGNYWNLLGVFGWVLTMTWANLYGVVIGSIHLQLFFFMCIGFLSNAEAQHYMVVTSSQQDDS